MKALVLSGGEMKGAYQAGVVCGLARRGARFHLLCGTSVGALNATFLADRMGQGADFEAAAEELLSFWMDQVTGPKALVEKRSALSLAIEVLRNRWTGYLSMDPLRHLMDQAGMTDTAIAASPVPAMVSVASLETGEVAYVPATKALAVASGTQPLLMKPEPVAGQLLYDGGLRDQVPLSYPIEQGADAIAIVVCQPADLLPAPRDLSLPSMAARTLAMLLNENLRGDLATFARVNEAVRTGTDLTHTYIPSLLLRPAAPFHASITKFTSTDISEMIGIGLTDAMALPNGALQPFLP